MPREPGEQPAGRREGPLQAEAGKLHRAGRLRIVRALRTGEGLQTGHDLPDQTDSLEKFLWTLKEWREED